MNTLSPRMLLDGLVFPEGPRWHDGKLWVSDMHAHRVLTVDLQGKSETVAQFDDKPSGIGFLPDGTPIVTLMRSRKIVRFGKGGISLHSDLSKLPGTNLNDMVVDTRGRAYAGYRDKSVNRANVKKGTEESTEGIVVIEPDGTSKILATGLRGPNGSAITPDGKTLIVAESWGDRLIAFRINDDGTLGPQRIFAELGTNPDGICLDASGAVWIGSPHGACFIRVKEGGEVLERINFEKGKWGVACVLGGPQRKTLFMLTAYTDRDNLKRLVDFQADLTSTSKGLIETVEVSVPGAGIP